MCLRFRRNLWYFCKSPMLPCSACILAATAAAAAVAAAAAAAAVEAVWLAADPVVPLLQQLRSGAPPLPHVSELVMLVTLLVRTFFLRFRSALAVDENATAVAAAVTAAAFGQDAGVPDEKVGDGLLAVFRTVSEHELLDNSGPSSSANVG